MPGRERRVGVREALAGLALLGGWALVTYGVAELTVPEAWPISGGLLLLSLFGWGFLRTVCTEGLYVLSRGRDD